METQDFITALSILKKFIIDYEKTKSV